MYKKVIYNTAAQIAGKAITASSSLLITILIGKSLGPAGYGEFTKIFVFVGYFYTFADFGLNAIFVRDSTKTDEAKTFKVLIATRVIFSLVLATIAIFISLTLPYNKELGIGFSPIAKTGILIASATIITQALFTTANAFFQKKLRYDLSTIAAIAGTLTILGLTFLNYLGTSSIYLFSASYVIGGIIFVLVAYFLINKKFKQSVFPTFDAQESKTLLRTSLPIGMALIFNLVYFRIDVLILSLSRSTHEVGIYGLAYQFFEAALSIPIFFTNALFPVLTKIYTNNINEYQRQVKKWALLLLVTSLALTLALIIVSNFITVIFDSRFSQAKNALIILSTGMPFFFISALLWHVLIINQKQKLLAPVYLLTAIINISLNFIFIPQYGYIAASVITVFSEAIVTLLLFVLSNSNKALPTKSTFA